MRRILVFPLLVAFSTITTISVLATVCGSYFQSGGADTFAGGPCPASFSKTAYWTIYFTDGYVTNPAVQVTEPGFCSGPTNGVYQACYPGYDDPTWTNKPAGIWNQVTHDAAHSGPGAPCVYNSVFTKDHEFSHDCSDCPLLQYSPDKKALSEGDCCSDEEFIACVMGGGEWVSSSCTCISPIVVDVLGNGFDLTNAQGGVVFEINGDGIPRQISWTSAGSDDAWLALDRNGNGVIDDGAELFGSAAPQPPAPPGDLKNGFLALAEFDRIENGGNSDRLLTKLDSVFNSLRLWQDVNHNGVSEASELHSMQELGLKSIELDYKTSRQVDEHGNQFRYRAKVTDKRGAQLGRWAWDVFLVTAP